MKKYNVKEIMIQAHDIRKAEGVTMGAALKKAWSVAKLTVGANPMDDKVQEYFKRLEAADEAMKALEEIKAEIQAACLESPDLVTVQRIKNRHSYRKATVTEAMNAQRTQARQLHRLKNSR